MKNENRMTKCDFCTMSSPSGKCFYVSTMAREDDCKEAIKHMVKAFGRNINHQTSIKMKHSSC